MNKQNNKNHRDILYEKWFEAYIGESELSQAEKTEAKQKLRAIFVAGWEMAQENTVGILDHCAGACQTLDQEMIPVSDSFPLVSTHLKKYYDNEQEY